MSSVLLTIGRLEEIEKEFEPQLDLAASQEAVELVRTRFLGRKSEISQAFQQLGNMDPPLRAVFGKRLNDLRATLEKKLDEKKRRLFAQPVVEAVDVTLPGVAVSPGRLHPITQTVEAIVACFVPMGFEVVEGPELEYEANNFDALNIPADHPSREAFDTFFVDAPSPEPRKGKLLLRSHTSPVQIRVMQTQRPPLRIVVPGKVFRPDPLDASHSFMFHQVEGLMVDDHTHFADLKGILAKFVERLFGRSMRVRFRPHFFPFTEPSAEVDIACVQCRGRGCATCGRKGWLEILGCGMVHPNVFNAVGYDPKTVQGFAFGLGVERIAMLQHGITDIRFFFENDLRFLEQF